VRRKRKKGLDPWDIESKIAAIVRIFRALKHDRIVTKVKYIVALRNHQDLVAARNFVRNDDDTVE
jgi:hypothetical protein